MCSAGLGKAGWLDRPPRRIRWYATLECLRGKKLQGKTARQDEFITSRRNLAQEIVIPFSIGYKGDWLPRDNWRAHTGCATLFEPLGGLSVARVRALFQFDVRAVWAVLRACVIGRSIAKH